MDVRKLHILRRQIGVLKHFDLRAGSTAVIVYAYYIEAPLARWWQAAQVLARHFRDFPAFVPVHGCLGRLHILRCAGLNFNEAKNIAVPSDQIDFSPRASSAIVAGDHGIPELAEMKVRFLFAPHSNLVIPRIAYPQAEL